MLNSLPLTVDQVEFASKLNLSPFGLRFLSLVLWVLYVLAIFSISQKISGLNKKVLGIMTILFVLSPWTHFLINFSPAIPKNLLLSSFRPANLETQINEEQKINFLATNKTYILPVLVRKFTYNKPVLAFEKIYKHAVAFLDIEQTVSPKDSYEIISLSGIPPKGTPKILYFWDIPLIFGGIYMSLRSKSGRKLIYLLLLSLIPYMFFEKNELAQSASLALPFFLIFEAQFIANLLSKYKKWTIFGGIAALVFVFSFLYSFYIHPENYLDPRLILYKQIGNYLKDNLNQRYAVTQRFGPSKTMVDYYLTKDHGETVTVDYYSFQFGKHKGETDIPTDGITYIGLIGEFVGPGGHLEKRPLPGKFKLAKEIPIDGEVVFDYGSTLWIGKFEP